jgi:hypothetical protein
MPGIFAQSVSQTCFSFPQVIKSPAGRYQLTVAALEVGPQIAISESQQKGGSYDQTFDCAG